MTSILEPDYEPVRATWTDVPGTPAHPDCPARAALPYRVVELEMWWDPFRAVQLHLSPGADVLAVDYVPVPRHPLPGVAL